MATAAPLAPVVSVIVPVFNAEGTLAETLQSALSGRYGNIEIIIIDDGSTDRSLAIAQEAAARDARIRIQRRANGGPSAAVNSGLAVARGDYVARLDSDDLWHPRKLEAQVALAKQSPNVAFIYAFSRYIDAEGRVLEDARPQLFSGGAVCRGIYESLIGVGSSALIKRAAMEQAGGCDEALRGWEDLLLQLIISSRHAIAVVPEYLVGYRVRPGSLSQDIDAMVESWRAIRGRLREDFPQVPEFVHAWAHGRRCAMFAEGYAWRRRHARSAASLIEAFWHDPAWTSEFLRFRVRRRVSKGSSQPEQPASDIHFFDCEPAQRITRDWFNEHPAQRRFARFEENRLRILAELDDLLARDPASQPSIT